MLQVVAISARDGSMTPWNSWQGCFCRTVSTKLWLSACCHFSRPFDHVSQYLPRVNEENIIVEQTTSRNFQTCMHKESRCGQDPCCMHIVLLSPQYQSTHPQSKKALNLIPVLVGATPDCSKTIIKCDRYRKGSSVISTCCKSSISQVGRESINYVK